MAGRLASGSAGQERSSQTYSQTYTAAGWLAQHSSAVGRVPLLLLVVQELLLRWRVLQLLLLLQLARVAAAAAAARHDPALLQKKVVQALHALRVHLRKARRGG